MAGNLKKTKTKSKTKTSIKTKKSKSSTKTGSKTTKSKTTTKKSSSKKGGNFFGTVGDLVAPTGWGSFATAATLVGIDQVDSALRRKKSEKSSAKKGGMSGGTPDDDALIVMQNNRWLTNAFLRLYNHAYTLDQAAPDELRSKLNNLIEKEIKYREVLSKKDISKAYKILIPNSIQGLKDLQKYGNGSHNNFNLYYTQMLELQPNINESSVNKTITNLEIKYSNKNKYSN
jgi:hypothetical protein